MRPSRELYRLTNWRPGLRYPHLDWLSMRSRTLSPSYMPLADEVILPLPPTGQGEREQESLALVIPTLFEAENIGGLLDHVRSVLDPTGIPYEILVVDDDSTDGTGDVVSAIAQTDPRVRLLVR